MRVPDQSQFYGLAGYYDALNASKDYRKESVYLESLVKTYARGRPRTWLDAACGTGRHLEWLRRHYAVAGFDLSPKMLRIARRRLGSVPLHLGDMRSVRLDGTFDVVTCLFSAIGHLRSERDLRRAFANFYRHLNPGGVALVEPWIPPDLYRPGFVQLRTYEGPEGLLARMSFSERRGGRSIVHFHFLIGAPGARVRYVVEKDVGLLVSRKQLLTLMREVGFRARYLSRGLTPGRGLLVGVKPGSLG